MLVRRRLKAIEDGLAGVADLANGVAPRINEFPESLTKLRCQRFHMQDDVQIFCGAEFQPGLFHGQGSGRAADQDVLISVVPEPGVAVGTEVTPRPPHRSVRAELPHTAPASGM